MQSEAVNYEPTGHLPDLSRCYMDSDENNEYDEDFDLNEVVFERSRKLTIFEILALLSVVTTQLWASNELPEDFCAELEEFFYRISMFAGQNCFNIVHFPWTNYPESFELKMVFFYKLMTAAAESLWADYNDRSISLGCRNRYKTLFLDIRDCQTRIIYAARVCEPWIQSAALNCYRPGWFGTHADTEGSETLKLGELDQGTCGSTGSESTESGGCYETAGSEDSSGGERGATCGGAIGEWIESCGCYHTDDSEDSSGGEKGATCGGAIGEIIESGGCTDGSEDSSGIQRFVSQVYHDCLCEISGNPFLWVFPVILVHWTAKTFVEMPTSATAVLQAFCESWPYIAAWILYIVHTFRSTRMVPDTSSDTNTRSSRKTAMIAKAVLGITVITLITLFSTHLRSLGNTRTEVSMGVKVARFDVSVSVSFGSSRSAPFSVPDYKELFAAIPALAGNTVRGISTQYQWIKSFGGSTPVSVPTPVAWYSSTALFDRCNDVLFFITECLSIGGATPVSVPTPVPWYSSTALFDRCNDILSFITEYLSIGGSSVPTPVVWYGSSALHVGIIAFCLVSQSTCLLASIPMPPWPNCTALYAGYHCISFIIAECLKGILRIICRVTDDNCTNGSFERQGFTEELG